MGLQSVRIDGEPPTFNYPMSAAEKNWRERVQAAIGAWEIGPHDGIRAEFVTSSDKRRGQQFDLDNMAKCVFDTFSGREPNYVDVSRRVNGVSPGVVITVGLPEPASPVFQCRVPVRRGSQRNPVSEPALTALSAFSGDDPLHVHLAFHENVSLTDFGLSGAIKPTVDCLWPILGGTSVAPHDYRIRWLVLTRSSSFPSGVSVYVDKFDGPHGLQSVGPSLAGSESVPGLREVWSPTGPVGKPTVDASTIPTYTFQPIGEFVVKLYDGDSKASISSTLTFERLDWRWLYLVHLGSILYTLQNPNASVLLEQIDRYAQHILAQFPNIFAYPPNCSNAIPDPLRGEIEVVSERPGGTAFRFLVQRIRQLGVPGDGMPLVMPVLQSPFHTGQLALGNLVFLRYVLDGAEAALDKITYQHFLILMIAAMTKFYRDNPNDIRHFASTINAPMYAQDLATKCLRDHRIP